MNDKHTPGPWHVIRYNHVDGDTWLAIGWTDAEGRKVGPLTEMVGGAVTDTPPCWSPVSRMKYIMGGDEQLLANAALIAAAPELLEACRAANRRFSNQNGRVDEEVWADNYPAVKALRDAIAKATGGAA